MRASILAADLPRLLKQAASDVRVAKDYLTGLDAEVGDGDLGRTMVSGFDRLAEVADTLPSDDLGGSLVRCGMAFNQVASSSFGTLLSFAMMAAGKEVKGKSEADLHDLVAMGRAAVESVQLRGKAKLGDKTMLDALVPAVDALEDAEKGGLSLSPALANAAEAANKAVEDTASLKAMIGRAGWFSDRTEGHKDPGAAAIAELIKSLSRSVAE